MPDGEMFCKARELARDAMNKAQSALEKGATAPALDWAALANGWCRVADLYREKR